MKTEKKEPQYKPVIEVTEILKSNLGKKEILFQLWDWKKNLKAQPGSVIATDMAEKFEVENFGEENNRRKFILEEYFEKKYPLLYKTFSQVEEVERYKGNFEKVIKAYTGLHRTDCEEKIETFCDEFKKLPETNNQEFFLKKYGSHKSIGLDKKLSDLEKDLNEKIQALEIWQNQTKLPDRYYLGEIKPNSLREFEKAKSNLNYIKLNGKTIAIENIEHWEGITGECHHGLGRLTSVDRGVYVNGKRHSIKRFDKGFLLDVLIPMLKPKNFSVPKELKSVQLEDHFELKEVTAKKSNLKIYSRNIFGLVWDYCVIDKQGVTFHADSQDELISGLQKKKAAIEENQKLKQVISSGKDEIISLGKLDSRDFKEFVARFKIKEHLKNKKILKSILTKHINDSLVAGNSGYISSYWENGVPLVKELVTEFCLNFKKNRLERNKQVTEQNLSDTWTLIKLHEQFRFCVDGIKTFCALNKIDPTSEIEGKKILEIARKNKRINERFSYELRVLFPTEEF